MGSVLKYQNFKKNVILKENRTCRLEGSKIDFCGIKNHCEFDKCVTLLIICGLTKVCSKCKILPFCTFLKKLKNTSQMILELNYSDP